MPKKILTIQTSKNDPPRIAFEIINRKVSKIDSDWNSIKLKPATTLMSGTQAPINTLYSRKIVLQAMVVTKNDFDHQEQPKAVARSDDNSWMESLSPAQRRRIEEAQARSGILEQNWNNPSFAEEASRVITNEANKPQIEESKIKISAENEEGVVRKTIDRASVEVRTQKSSQRIQGIIELKGLPPPTDNQWQFHVARYDNGVKVEDGSFDIKTSKYSMDVADLDGSIVAQLFDSKTGSVVGEGKLRLSEFVNNKATKITVVKTNNHLAANFPGFYEQSSLASRSKYSPPSKPTEVHLASLDLSGSTSKEGAYNFDQIHNKSWTLLRAKRQAMSEGLFLAQAGQENSLVLMPESMMNALRNIVSEQNLSSEVAPTGSIIWGQITQTNRPMGGVSVQIEGYPDYKPIYFNSFLIPDSRQNVTSENGYFAFVDVPAGFHTVTAAIGALNLSHQNVVVDDNTVSLANLSSLLEVNAVSLRVYDAFAGSPMSANLDLQSLPDSLRVDGYAKINLPNISRLSLLQVNPVDPNYSPALHLYNDEEDNINVPLVRTSWLQDLIYQKRINVIPQKGTIIGFVPEWEYQVYLGQEADFPKENIIYFDSRGQVSEKGVPGGGFVIVNVPLGTQSIVITDSKSDMIFSQVAPVDESALVTLKF